MAPIRLSVFYCLVICLLPVFFQSPVLAQSDDSKADAAKCRQVQAQLDAVMSIAQSATLSEAEKMAKLRDIIAQSFVAMQSNAKNIAEAAQIAREWTETLQRLLGTADVAGAAPSDSVSSEAKTGADIVKNRVKPYVQVMKLMCPDLVIPDSLGK